MLSSSVSSTRPVFTKINDKKRGEKRREKKIILKCEPWRNEGASLFFNCMFSTTLNHECHESQRHARHLLCWGRKV